MYGSKAPSGQDAMEQLLKRMAAADESGPDIFVIGGLPTCRTCRLLWYWYGKILFTKKKDKKI
jgi:hypothetical protein